MQPFAYYRPSEPAQAVAATQDGAKFLAGGTTLYDLMKLGIETPDRIVDINTLPFREIVMDEDTLTLGAMVRMSEAAENELIVQNHPALSEALWRAASQQLRNMASLGGNLLQRTRCGYFRHGAPFACNKREPMSGCAAIDGLNRVHALFGGSESCIASYAGDFAIALIALDAEIDLLGPDGIRRIPIAELHREPGNQPELETTLRPGELITSIRVPLSNVARASTYHKIRDRESYAFALVSVAAGLAVESGVIVDARIALGGVATRPWRATAGENVLIGEHFTEEIARRAGEAAFSSAVTTPRNEFKVELGIRAVADALTIAYLRGSNSDR